MKLYIFSNRDKKMGCYHNPYFTTDDVEHQKIAAIRSARIVEPGDRSRIADHALYHLGIFDDESGKFELLPEAEKLLDYEDYVPAKES